VFQRIMFTWDGSDVALRAFDVAIDLARRCGGELVAVSVAYSPAHAETHADREESAEAARRYLERTFGEVADRAHRAGVDVAHEIIESDTPAQALAAHCRDHDFDLIVCGHHHGARVGRLLLHDIAEDLVGEAMAPVLVVGDPGRE
jgi:nucleotide-binding universal stress UspA family protein